MNVCCINMIYDAIVVSFFWLDKKKQKCYNWILKMEIFSHIFLKILWFYSAKLFFAVHNAVHRLKVFLLWMIRRECQS